MRRTPILALLVTFGLIATGCGGGGDDDDTAEGTTTTTAPGEAGGGDTSTTVAGDPGATVTTAPGDTGGGDGGTAATTPGGTGGTGALDASGPAPNMTGDEICAAIPGDVVGSALGVSGVTATPGGSGTPQCSYRFDLPSGQPTDATVAALRSAEDMGGRFGDDAFDFVVSLNKAAAQDAVTETPLGIGNNSVLLAGSRLYMAVIQLGGRIVTVLLNANAGDAAAITALASRTTVLAPQ